MSDTTLIGIVATAAVVVVLALLFLRRRPGPPDAPDQSVEGTSPSALADSSSATPVPTSKSVEKEERAAAIPAAKPSPGPETPGPDAPSRESKTEEQRTTAAVTGAVEKDTPSPGPDDAVKAFKQGLSTTRSGFISKLANLFKGKPTVDTALLDEMEEILLTADIGVKTSDHILEALRSRVKENRLEGEAAVWDALRQEARKILAVETAPPALDKQPSLILVAGVNGVGKTTTIGKLAAKYRSEGRRVLLAAGDTYRAAAVLQLEVWGERTGCPVVKGKEGADPGSVMFDAITRARDEGYDLVIADTAGRLHTKQPLMDELKKVDRTVTKALGGRNADEILLVLDATTGQNAVQQMHMFRGALGITGVVLTKLDGTAKGGVILGIVDEHKVPVRFVGLGERVEDLREFSAEGFVKALFERPDEETMAA